MADTKAAKIVATGAVVSAIIAGIFLIVEGRESPAQLQEMSVHVYWQNRPFTEQNSQEITRGNPKMAVGEDYWIPSPNQSIPREIPCKTGMSVGWNCHLDMYGRIQARIRTSCMGAPMVGEKATERCSITSSAINPNVDLQTVMCCFYEDGPTAKNWDSHHKLNDWIIETNEWQSLQSE